MHCELSSNAPFSRDGTMRGGELVNSELFHQFADSAEGKVSLAAAAVVVSVVIHVA